MKILYFTLILTLLIGCATTQKGWEKEKIIFKKQFNNKREIFKIIRPEFENRNKTTLLQIGGHGVGFQIVYSDSSTIYYSNDYVVSTPNYINYESAKLNIHSRLNTVKDTTISGQQSDGRYWKEIKKGMNFFGYINVSPDEKEIFDQAILSIKKMKASTQQ